MAKKRILTNECFDEIISMISSRHLWELALVFPELRRLKEKYQEHCRPKIKCPFHKEKTPSFEYNLFLGHAHCFGCGIGVDMISYVMKKRVCSFYAAVIFLGRFFGVKLRFQRVEID